MLTRNLKRAAGVAVAATAMVLTVAAVPANAATQTITTSCTTDLGDVNGHAKMRNCVIKWNRDLNLAEYWQTVEFELLDSMSDGYCARGQVTQDGYGSVGETDKYASSCNGLWQKKTFSFGTRAADIWIAIGYGSTNDVSGWQPSWNSRTFVAPVGY